MLYYVLLLGRLYLFYGMYVLYDTAPYIFKQVLVFITQYYSPLIGKLTILMTKLGNMPAIITALCIYYLMFIDQKKFIQTIFLLLNCIGSISIKWSLKYVVHRNRPQTFEHLVQSYSASFPSAHSLYATVLKNFIMLFVYKDLRYTYRTILMHVIFLWAITMGVSRVHLAIHCPSDVLAGWGIGFIWAGLLYLCYQQKHIPNLYEKSKLKIEVKS